ncbi:MAG: hypothetical protein HY549_07965 [Elusimicrobia bacterium]|nr:hypothetical protein [Elusimicrobiota bacterium]
MAFLFFLLPFLSPAWTAPHARSREMVMTLRAGVMGAFSRLGQERLVSAGSPILSKLALIDHSKFGQGAQLDLLIEYLPESLEGRALTTEALEALAPEALHALAGQLVSSADEAGLDAQARAQRLIEALGRGQATSFDYQEAQDLILTQALYLRPETLSAVVEKLNTLRFALGPWTASAKIPRSLQIGLRLPRSADSEPWAEEPLPGETPRGPPAIYSGLEPGQGPRRPGAWREPPAERLLEPLAIAAKRRDLKTVHHVIVQINSRLLGEIREAIELISAEGRATDASGRLKQERRRVEALYRQAIKIIGRHGLGAQSLQKNRALILGEIELLQQALSRRRNLSAPALLWVGAVLGAALLAEAAARHWPEVGAYWLLPLALLFGLTAAILLVRRRR